MSRSLLKDLAAEVGALYGAANTAVTAGGAGDATEVTGVTIDQDTAQATPALKAKDFNALTFVVGFTTTLANTQSLTVTAKIEDSADGSTWATYVDSKTIASVTATANATYTGTGKINADLTGARRYVRVKFTPNLSAANTDTAALSCVALLGGATYLPVA